MSTRLRFFRMKNEVETSQRFLIEHGIKTFIRERSAQQSDPGEEIYGYDLFVLKDEELQQAKDTLLYEFGSSWGE